jgi:hypothetical protein
VKRLSKKLQLRPQLDQSPESSLIDITDGSPGNVLLTSQTNSRRRVFAVPSRINGKLFLGKRVCIEGMDVESKKSQGVFLCVAYFPHSRSELSHSEVF